MGAESPGGGGRNRPNKAETGRTPPWETPCAAPACSACLNLFEPVSASAPERARGRRRWVPPLRCVADPRGCEIQRSRQDLRGDAGACVSRPRRGAPWGDGLPGAARNPPGRDFSDVQESARAASSALPALPPGAGSPAGEQKGRFSSLVSFRDGSGCPRQGAESPGGRRLKQGQTGSNRVNTPLRNTVRRPGVLSLFEPV